RLSVNEPNRSALPMAAAAVTCIGLLPILGSPAAPLHWFMTAGITGLGILIGVRHRLQRPERPLAPLDANEARSVGRHLLIIGAAIAVIATVIIGLGVHAGGKPIALSLVLPALSVAWVFWLGFKLLRVADDAVTPATEDALPARASAWEARPSQPPAASSRSSSNPQVSA
ncbi:MAG TPA: hypothetical protein VIW29_02965, partial [Polyangiaceae bacterium]